MTKMRRQIVKGGLLAVLLSSAAFAAKAETLGNALVSAYRSSDLIEQNRAVLRAADEDVAGAVATLRPVISWVLLGQYSKTVSQPEGTTTISRLNLDWTLYDFGRSQIGVDIAKEQVLATRQALVGVEQNVLLAGVQAYMDMRRAQDTVGINQTSVRVIGEQLKAAQDRFEVGEITKTDVAQAEAALAAGRAGLAAAEGDLNVARASYKAAIGHAPDRIERIPATPKLPRSLQEAQSIALRLNPAILEAQHQAKVADLQVEQAAAERRPTLGVNLRADDDLGGGTNQYASLQMSQTLYAGGRLSSLHRKAIAGRDAARSALSRAGVQISQQVANAWSTIEVARAQITAIDRQIVAAQAAYDGVQEEAKLGSRTTLDVLNAEQDVLQARSDRVSAEANLQVANYSLLASMGLLTADHLNLGIPTYDAEAYYNAVKSAPVTSVQGKSLDRVLKAIGKN